ncbi:hypothetical protein CASFOL_001193 [Castilleja foliolosa]|uniref:NB-ARC domain-containing protein n=1 Tax=Castilleja foliolosa TaxID=1961234 RepID=A0ABD3EMG3_9LAMI
MDYAALTSLKRTIERLLNSSYISITSPSLKTLNSTYREVNSLQENLKKLDRNSSSSRDTIISALDGKFRRDVLETHVSTQFLKDKNHPFSFSLDLQDLKIDIAIFRQAARTTKKAYADELGNAGSEKEDDISSGTLVDWNHKSEMIGFSNEVRLTIDRLREWWKPEIQAVSLVGMAGIGKTTLAMDIVCNQFISEYFDFRAWVSVGPKKGIKDILLGFIDEMNDNDEMVMETEEELFDYLKSIRFLIVLDDVWDKQIWHEFKKLFPDGKTASRVLLTTRLEEVAHDASDPSRQITNVPFMNKEESWHLLRLKVFGDEKLCPRQLEKPGKKIAENCEGLPLLIITIADVLSKSGDKTVEYWNEVAERKNSVFKDANYQLSSVLFPSYNYLPQHLKACFLYVGVFPLNHDIPVSTLVKLWGSERFLEPNWWNSLEDLSMDFVEDLVSRNLVMTSQKSSTGRIKTCGLHSVFWHLCVEVAAKNKFFGVLNSRADGLSEEGMNSQLRLCIHNNVLFGIKDVYNSMGTHCASTARSLVCYGPPHQYQVPICYDLRLLRVLDALTIRFYEFPGKVLKLVQLRYLALTCNGNLSPSISKLWNLEFLIVHRYLNIKSSSAQSCLPLEIWDMKELKHLEITGCNLPIPCDDRHLQNLVKFLDVSPQSCTIEILGRFPNLKKLGVRIEVEPDSVESHLCFFDQISHLHFLESLKCVVVNPNCMSRIIDTPCSTTIFPPGLKKLSLNGFGYSWDYMRGISSLPNLEVLKLRCYAFQGAEWEIREGEFVKLKFLLLEDSDLTKWRVGRGCFMRLQRLVIRHCYKLVEIPLEFNGSRSFDTIEVVDCSPSTIACAKEIMKEYDHVKGYVHCSW